MTEQGLSDLERKLKRAFSELADALPQALVPMGTLPSRSRRRRQPVLVGSLVAVVTVVAVALGLFMLSLNDKPSQPSAVRTAGAADAPTQTTETPSGVGKEAPLTGATNADTDFLVMRAGQIGSQRPGTAPVVVAMPGKSPVVVTQRGSDDATASGCMTIASPKGTSVGYVGSCTPPGKAGSQFAVTNDHGADIGTDPNATWYLVWTQVPRGTAYVVFSYRSQESWQRPINGVSYFTLTIAGPEPGVPLPVARAFSANGVQIGEANVNL